MVPFRATSDNALVGILIQQFILCYIIIHSDPVAFILIIPLHNNLTGVIFLKVPTLHSITFAVVELYYIHFRHIIFCKNPRKRPSDEEVN